ncbi:NAD(P)-binding domain-containing protein [Dactylosporangium sp. NPDC005572]|uniref:NAD(P)-binding domain-containing protein n=1 Tax=Dactylosporangium sp. NPDC005572 TaxID=3156889 RepID=UPI0033B3F253
MTSVQGPRPRAGVIGLGTVGGGVAISLARNGMAPVAVCDVWPEASAAHAGISALVASPAAVAAVADVVLLAVADAVQARDILDGTHGLLSAAHDGLTAVLLSTVSIEAVYELADLCASRGVALLDGGVMREGHAAENGLVVMLGGPDDVVDRALPVLGAFAKAVVHCGPLGTGMVTKLARNAIIYGHWAVVYEAAAMARASGVALEHLLTVVAERDDAGSDPLSLLRGVQANVPIAANRVAATVRQADRDLAAAQALAAHEGLETPILDRVRSAMDAVFSGRLAEALPDEPRARGLAMMDRAYGKGFSARIPEGSTVPFIEQTIDQLLAEVWARPYLPRRDRRLFTLGITAMLGRADLLEVQLRGALVNGELTVAQLRELVLHGSYYAGWGNGTVLQTVVEDLIAESPPAS